MFKAYGAHKLRRTPFGNSRMSRGLIGYGRTACAECELEIVSFFNLFISHLRLRGGFFLEI
jgi:hypothetical protein